MRGLSTTKTKERTYEVCLHLLNRLIGDGKAELFLRNGQVQPEFTPGVETHLCDFGILSAYVF